MSAIGRIFLVLNLILAAVFLGWASTSLATSADYKNKFDTEARLHSETKALMDTDKSTLQAENMDIAAAAARKLERLGMEGWERGSTYARMPQPPPNAHKLEMRDKVLVAPWLLAAHSFYYYFSYYFFLLILLAAHSAETKWSG